MSDDGTLTEEGILPDTAAPPGLLLQRPWVSSGSNQLSVPTPNLQQGCRTRVARPALLVFVLLRRMRLHNSFFLYFCAIASICNNPYSQVASCTGEFVGCVGILGHM